MQFSESRLNAAIGTARTKANGNRALLNAIDKASAGLRGGWIVTELHDGLLITTEGGTYKSNETCSCAAYRNGMICKHRIAYRIVSVYHETPEPAPAVRRPTITRSVERDHTGARIRVTYCDNWAI